MTSHHFLLTDSLTSLCGGAGEGSASETEALPACCARAAFCFTLRRLPPPPQRHYAANASNYEESRSTRGRAAASKQRGTSREKRAPPQPEALTEQRTSWFARAQSKGLNYLSLPVSRQSEENIWVKEKNEIETTRRFSTNTRDHF